MGWFRRGINEDDSTAERGLSEQERTQRRVFISTFAMLAKMAGADGTVKKREVEAVDRFMKDVLKLDEGRRQFAIRVFNNSRHSEKTFREYAEEYRDLLKDKPEMYQWMVDVLARISLADEVFSGPEAALLQTACEIFGIDPGRYARLQARLDTAEEEEDDAPYQVLGCTVQSSNEEIQRKYQELQNQYDPERIVKAGLPEEFALLAEEKLTKIRLAFQEISNRRGLA